MTFKFLFRGRVNTTIEKALRIWSFVIVEVNILIEMGILSSFWMVCNECKVHGREEDCQEGEVKEELPKKSSKPTIRTNANLCNF